jgi:hypothetical protein
MLTTIAISLLLERIKHPDYKVEQLCTFMKKSGITISIEAIDEFFQYHGVERKNDFRLIILLTQLIDSLSNDILPATLFSGIFPEINFSSSVSDCPYCGKKLHLYKTVRRIVYTMHIGGIKTHEVFLVCGNKNCKNNIIYKSETLAKLIPKRSSFGFDILEYIGRSIYQRFRTEKEIVEELAQRNIKISASEVNCLSKKFVVYLALLHSKLKPIVKSHLQNNGGYILHIDGTSEGGSPHLFCGLDELSNFLLHSVKIRSENNIQISEFLEELKTGYGIPIAIVCDMSKAILLAIENTFKGEMMVFICHFHFLRDIGKDLLEEQYGIIRKVLKRYGISTALKAHCRRYLNQNTELASLCDKFIEMQKEADELDKPQTQALCYSLIQWVLDGKKQGQGYGFPFDKPHLDFYNRLSKMEDILQQWSSYSCGITTDAQKEISKILKDIKGALSDKKARNSSRVLKEKTIVFDELREALHITLKESKKGLNDGGDDVEIKLIRQKIHDFKNQIQQKYKSENKDYNKMIKQIDKYEDKLFADPIKVKTPEGEIEIQPQRTNNSAEQNFRGIRRSERRRTGNKSMKKRLQTMIAETPLVKNLENPEYMKILLGDKKSLAECFAEIDYDKVKKKIETVNNEELILPNVIKAINLKDFQSMIIKAFCHFTDKSNSNLCL